jgi:hypothetical protein
LNSGLFILYGHLSSTKTTKGCKTYNLKNVPYYKKTYKAMDIPQERPGTVQDLEGAYQKGLGGRDPLTCPQCGSEMRIISLIQDPDVILQILKHLGLWKQDAGSQCKKPKPDHGSVVPAYRQTGMRNLMMAGLYAKNRK